MKLSIEPHPLLDAVAFTTRYPEPLASFEPETLRFDRLVETFPVDYPEPGSAKKPIRDLLRFGGFKPSGRNKPASEYVRKAVEAERLGPINPAVDACNATSYFYGLPISVIDPERATSPFRIAIADADARYVFNPAGQSIRLGGLVCLFDEEGPCANAVKDSQRTKTHPETTRTLSVLWGTTALPGRTEKAATWYRERLEAAGAETEDVETEFGD